MKEWLTDDREQLDKHSSNFVQLCATLSGFSGAFVILLLTPGNSTSLGPEIEWALICFLVSAFGYTVAATFYTNATLRQARIAKTLVGSATLVFLICNLLTLTGFVVLVHSANYRYATLVAIMLLLVGFWFFWMSARRK